MTRGRLVLIEKENAYVMSEINGDMFPNRRGIDVILYYYENNILCIDDLISIYQIILKDKYEDDTIKCSKYDINELFSFYSDYLYVVNTNDYDVFVGDICIKSNCLSIYHYKEYITSIIRKDDYEIILEGHNEITLFEKSLDFYSRLLMGQYSNIVFDLRINSYFNTFNESFINNMLLAVRTRAIPDIKQYLVDNINASYGITNEEVDIKGRLAYEILKTIMHNRAYKEHPEGGYSVEFNEPLKVTYLEYPVNNTEIINGTIVSKTRFKKHHLKTIVDSLCCYESYLDNRFKDMFSIITSDCFALSIADIISNYLYLECKMNTKSDDKSFNEIKSKIIKQIFGV